MKWLLLIFLLLSSASSFGASDVYVASDTSKLIDLYLNGANMATNYSTSTSLFLRDSTGADSTKRRYAVVGIKNYHSALKGTVTSIDSIKVRFYTYGNDVFDSTAKVTWYYIAKWPIYENNGTTGLYTDFFNFRDSLGSYTDSLRWASIGCQSAGVSAARNSTNGTGYDRWSNGSASCSTLVEDTNLVKLVYPTTNTPDTLCFLVKITGGMGHGFLTTCQIPSKEYALNTDYRPRFYVYYTYTVAEPPRTVIGPAGTNVVQGPTGKSKVLGP